MEESQPVIDVESEQFQTLLAEALRAGPHSQQWLSAVAALKAARERGGPSPANLDEYALLCAAREHLENGKDYRSVRPGVGFTRKLMEGLEKASGGGLRTANLIAIASTGVVLLILGIALVVMRDSGSPAGIAQLADTVFVKDIISTHFNAPTVSTQWRAFGDLPLKYANGLKPAAPSATEPATLPGRRSGGVISMVSFPADKAFRAECSLRLTRGDDGIFQFFVSDSPEDSLDKAPATQEASAEKPAALPLTPHELVWLLQAGQSSVALPDGTFAPAGDKGDKFDAPRQLTVRITVKDNLAIVECGGKQLFADVCRLNSTPRYVGVRFVQKPGDKVEQRVTVDSIDMKMP